MKQTNKIIIYGTGGLGRGTADLIEFINQSGTDYWNALGFVDDNESNNMVNGLPVLGNSNYLLDYHTDINVVLAFGRPDRKQKLYQMLQANPQLHFPNLIHPSVEIARYNQLGKGNIISKGVALSTNIVINDFNLIHYNCSVGHDVSMGDFNSVFPLVALSGYDRLGDCVEIGTNSAVIPNIKLGDNSVVGAGSTIINDVREDSKVAGVPGKEI